MIKEKIKILLRMAIVVFYFTAIAIITLFALSAVLYVVWNCILPDLLGIAIPWEKITIPVALAGALILICFLLPHSGNKL